MFREFTRNAFFDFEKQLEEEINIASGKSSGKSKQKQKRGFEVSPAFSLKYALHDACLEYRWDELIISSPQKASKSRRERSNVKKDEHDQQQTKFVFAFLPCPISLYDLEQFCEHKSNFSTSYLKKTLINTGKQESHLFDLLKASLFWLDTRNLWESKQILTVTQSDLDSAGHQSDEDDTLAALPYSSALDYYTKKKQNCCGLTTSSHSHLGENPEDRENSEMNIVLYDSQDESAVPVCSLNIQLMWSCETSISEKTNMSADGVDDVAVNDDDVAANKDDLTNTDTAHNNKTMRAIPHPTPTNSSTAFTIIW
ncbi:hypothetical protein BSL78_25863 [Apostichopus japonicus]|uniref:Treslin N-terminal domain-containing protein n=1 Tax=Stichopus japonicus TaxID=307972 RepID=A0A2G8JNK0_STIJA|nr:hypothetical protein BSL78_25863 [Apostichopus japonicus]